MSAINKQYTLSCILYRNVILQCYLCVMYLRLVQYSTIWQDMTDNVSGVCSLRLDVSSVDNNTYSCVLNVIKRTFRGALFTYSFIGRYKRNVFSL